MRYRAMTISDLGFKIADRGGRRGKTTDNTDTTDKRTPRLRLSNPHPCYLCYPWFTRLARREKNQLRSDLESEISNLKSQISNPESPGFTLLEVLLALSLSILLLTAVSMAISIHLRAVNAGRLDVEQAQLARAI